MPNFFKDKVAIVTGASSGIGLETARALWENGAKVVLAARRKSEIDSLSKKLKGSLSVATDITQDIEVEQLVKQTLHHFKKIDILINNAGILLHKLIVESSDKEFKEVMEVNFFSAVRCARKVIPIMQKQGNGAILNIASIAGRIGLPNLGTYSASKFALIGYSQALRQELKDSGIFVGVVCPGIVYTPMNATLIEEALQKGKKVRFVHPKDMAQKILFAIEKRKSEIFYPKLTRFFYWAHFFFPSWMEALAWKLRASNRKN